MSGEVRVITRDGHLVRQFKCPGCGSWGDIDDDQFNGRVSIDHTGDGCSFHETVDLHDAQRRERAARAVAGGEPTNEPYGPITVPHEMFPFCCKQPADSEIHGGAGGEPTRPSDDEWSARVIDAVFNDPENLDVILCDHDHEVRARVVAAVEAQLEAEVGKHASNGWERGAYVHALRIVRAARGATGGKT